MKKLSKNALIGYPAGIITGITYGLNPLFAVPLMKHVPPPNPSSSSAISLPY